MERAVLLSVEEYLSTTFEGADREHVDGRVLERNVGEIGHVDWQTGIATFLRTRYPQFWFEELKRLAPATKLINPR